jgi:hypothetical protein
MAPNSDSRLFSSCEDVLMFWLHQDQAAVAGWIETSTQELLHHGSVQSAEAPASATA